MSGAGGFYDHHDIDPFGPLETDEDEINDYDDGFDDDEDCDSLGPLMLKCSTPGCLMPGLHFASECYTIEDAMDHYAYRKEDE